MKSAAPRTNRGAARPGAVSYRTRAGLLVYALGRSLYAPGEVEQAMLQLFFFFCCELAWFSVTIDIRAG